MTCESLLNISLSLFLAGWICSYYRMNFPQISKFMEWYSHQESEIRQWSVDLGGWHEFGYVLRASCTILHVNGMQFMWADNVWLETRFGKDDIKLVVTMTWWWLSTKLLGDERCCYEIISCISCYKCPRKIKMLPWLLLYQNCQNSELDGWGIKSLQIDSRGC